MQVYFVQIRHPVGEVLNWLFWNFLDSGMLPYCKSRNIKVEELVNNYYDFLQVTLKLSW